VGIELVADRTSRAPFPRSARVTEGVVAAARRAGLLVYSGTGNADGINGDLILLGPPFVVTDEELVRISAMLAEAIDAAVEPAIDAQAQAAVSAAGTSARGSAARG